MEKLEIVVNVYEGYYTHMNEEKGIFIVPGHDDMLVLYLDDFSMESVSIH